IVVRMVDAVTDPLMGLITDRIETRWGRYRPYFLVFAIPFGISVFLVFTTPDADYGAKLAWAYATYLLVTLFFTIVTMPYIPLIGVLTANPKDRLPATGYRLFFAKLAAFIVTILAPVLAESWGRGNLAEGYRWAMGLMGLIATLLFLLC